MRCDPWCACKSGHQHDRASGDVGASRRDISDQNHSAEAVNDIRLDSCQSAFPPSHQTLRIWMNEGFFSPAPGAPAGHVSSLAAKLHVQNRQRLNGKKVFHFISCIGHMCETTAISFHRHISAHGWYRPHLKPNFPRYHRLARFIFKVRSSDRRSAGDRVRVAERKKSSQQ